jgi:mannonate dehydratase
MKLGLGLYRSMLTRDNYRFARQLGCTHLAIHLVDYFKEQRIHGTDGTGRTWGITQNQDCPWTEEDLCDLKKVINDEGLVLEAIENLDPSHWHDIILDGPKKKEQIEGVKEIVRIMGRVGIPVLGYNFSVAGVWGHVTGPFARGGAESVAFLGPEGPQETPIPHGQVWNMIYDLHAPDGLIHSISHDQLWERVEYFLSEVVPVAEDAGVTLAAHPDDPPTPVLRGTPRLVYQAKYYKRLLDLNPSPANSLEFCLGTLQEMIESEVYEAVDDYSKCNRIAYVHCRNVRGKVPRYHEVFIDEGDLDVWRALRILHRNGFNGMIIPDHTPLAQCDAPWHAGMAHALGYLGAILQALERNGMTYPPGW